VQAEKIFEEDLGENPNNHWSLYGLYQALQQQKKNKAAEKVKAQFNTAFNKADIKPGVVW
jgi:hypothetical protein